MLNQALKLVAYLLSDRNSEAVRLITGAVRYADSMWPANQGGGISKLGYVREQAMRYLEGKPSSVVDAIIHVLLILVRRTGGPRE